MENYKNRTEFINYIIGEFQKNYPTCNADILMRCFKAYSDDEIYRFANMIERFGLTTIMSFIHDRQM